MLLLLLVLSVVTLESDVDWFTLVFVFVLLDVLLDVFTLVFEFVLFAVTLALVPGLVLAYLYGPLFSSS